MLEAEEKGEIAVNTMSGTKLIFDVLYVLMIDQNLLSVGQLLKRDCSVTFNTFKNKTCLIYDANGNEMFRVKIPNKNFLLSLNNECVKSYAAMIDESNLWHKRLGHYHYSTLRKL